MKIFKNIECIYSCRDENDELLGGKYICTVISDRGDISFAVIKKDEQLLINEKMIKMAIKRNERIETDGIYMFGLENHVLPIKCKVHITVMPLITNFFTVDINNSIGIKNKDLKIMLNIK